MSRLRLPVVGALGAWTLLMIAVSLGAAVPAALRLGSMPSSPRWAAIAPPAGGLAPLEASYIARVLGLDPAELAARGAHPATITAASGDGSRIVVEHAGSNDRVQHAYEIPGVPFTARTDIGGATRDADEPAGCGAGGGTVWYAYTADRDRQLLASTAGSDFAAALAVYDHQGRALGCEVDGSGNAQVSFAASAGERYLFQVAGTLGGGRLVFSLDVVGGVRLVASEAAAWVSPTISEDGRVVAFRSRVVDLTTGSSTLIRGRHDRPVGAVFPEVSGDGTAVVFSSVEVDVVEGDTNGYEDVFLYEVDTGVTRRISVSSSGAQGHVSGLHEMSPDDGWELTLQSQEVSRDGRHAVFSSALSGLVDGDDESCTAATHGHAWVPRQPRHAAPAETTKVRCRDVFVHDAAHGTTVRISETPDGRGADGDSGSVDISADGRFVAFASDARNLVDGDAKAFRDVFVHDRDADGDGVFDEQGATAVELVSVAADGEPADGSSAPYVWPRAVSISADGRYVAFVSEADNLTPRTADGTLDIFVRDRWSGVTTMVPAALGPVPTTPSPSGGFFFAGIDLSADGNHVVFDLPAVDAADVQQRADPCTVNSSGGGNVYLHDRAAGVTVLVSSPADGSRANAVSAHGSVSADGRFVAFFSEATNIEDEHEPQCRDDPTRRTYPKWVYVYERPSRA